jgi:hypothetical protein
VHLRRQGGDRAPRGFVDGAGAVDRRLPRRPRRRGDSRGAGAKWEGDELVTYDMTNFNELLQYYEQDAYLPDND